MGQNLIACDREQSFVMPPDVREWLPEGHLAWFVIDAVAEMDWSAFYAAYRADGHGRAAYDPAMMVTSLLSTYARGARSSRAIERTCEEDVACVLAGERGAELYGKRQPMIEPVFGDMKFNGGMDRFHRRGRAAVRTKSRLITATDDLLKLHRHSTTPAVA
jgi:hypothetical protein